MLVVCHTAGIYITPLYSTLACVETRARIKAEKAREMRKVKIKNNLGWWPGEEERGLMELKKRELRFGRIIASNGLSKGVIPTRTAATLFIETDFRKESHLAL